MKISKKLFNLETESSFEILAKANKLKADGKNIINLGIGQPDFLTPKNIVEAGKKALNDGLHGYTPSNGIIELREAVSENIYENYNVDINPENIVAIIFVLKYPTIIAIIAAYIFGSVNSIKFP